MPLQLHMQIDLQEGVHVSGKLDIRPIILVKVWALTSLKPFSCVLFMQTECIDLSAKRRENVPEIFAKSRLSRDTCDVIDSDGLPRVGEVVNYLYKLGFSCVESKQWSSFFFL